MMPAQTGPPAPSSRKRGRLSAAECDYIRAHAGSMHPHAIAAKLRRTPERVLQFLADEPPPATPPTPASEAETAARVLLRQSAAWRLLQQEFEREELQLFEEQYAAYLSQFDREGVLASEQTQLMKAVKYEVLMSRNLRQQKRLNTEIEGFEAEKEEVLREYPTRAGRPKEQQGRLLGLMTDLATAYEQKSARSREFIQLEEKNQALMHGLKATRDQRLAKIDTPKTSLLDIIKTLAEQDNAEREGRQIEQMRRATEKELRRLGTPHVFADGQTDLPVLSADTLAKLEE